MRHVPGSQPSQYLEILAGSMPARGQPSRAARLWGAADRVGEPAGMTGQQLFDLPIIGEIDPEARGYYAQAESTARAHLGEAAFAAAWAEGRSLPLDAKGNAY
jgi:hypothetical protein